MNLDDKTVGEIRQIGEDYERATEILQVIKKAIEEDGRGNPDGPWKANHLMLSAILYVCATAMAVELSQDKLLATVKKMRETLETAMSLDALSETVKDLVVRTPTNGK